MKRALIILCFPIIYLVFVGKILSTFVGDLYYTQSISFLDEKYFEKSLDSINKAIKSNEYEPAYRRQKAKVLLAKKLLAKGSEEKDLADSALEDLKQAELLNPKNLATLRNSVPLYYFLHSEFYPETEEIIRAYYSNLKKTYPNDLGLLVDIAKNEKKLGFDDDYEKTKSVVAKLRPDIINWHEAFK